MALAMAADQHFFLLTMPSSSLLMILFFFLQSLFQSCHANSTPLPSACGIIPNISDPFFLKGHPTNCSNGYTNNELACEDNVASVYFDSQKYYVKDINYENGTIRLVDASINNDDSCSFPNSSLFSYKILSPYSLGSYYHEVAWPINFMSCPTPLKNSPLFTDITHDCLSLSSQPRFTYIKVGHMNVSDAPQACRIELIVMTSFKFNDSNNVSFTEIHRSLLYGFNLNFLNEACIAYSNTKWDAEKFRVFLYHLLWILVIIVGLLCAWVSPPIMAIIVGLTAVAGLSYMAVSNVYFNIAYISDYTTFYRLADYTAYTTSGRQAVIELVIELIILAPRIIIFPLALCFLIYKFRRRNLSAYTTIERFLQSDNKLIPIKYSYSDIKKMTRNFQDKLGEGGYGSVYKGKLRSGIDVAVKILGKSGENGQDFINEISTIGRIHHVNVVKLVGYCAQGAKRALVFDFMSNGSLEKFLFNREKNNSMNWDTKFGIAVGIARGIKYLHQGCNIQILHFDIKPHNILLDDKFVPKISDFGLAKFCSTDKNTVTMTAARGTVGYVAPELINRGIGPISYKADVYSFGMLLMEMVNLNRHLKGNNGDSSQYFPNWIYDRFNQGRDIEIENVDENHENDSMRKLAHKLTIVALWCIQMSPDDRPPINKVLEMLEGDVELLHIPDYPSPTSTHIELNVDQVDTSCSIDSLPFLHHEGISSNVEITVE